MVQNYTFFPFFLAQSEKKLYLCEVMRKILTIAIFILGVLFFGSSDFAPLPTHSQSEFTDTHREQLECCHRHNIDAERTSTVVVPSVRTTLNTAPRYQQNRTSQNAIVGRSITTSNYLVSRFIHRLGTCARAVDFYLYTLCRLRL